MEIRVYTIYDSKSGLFSRLMLFPTDGVAMREFRSVVTDKTNEIGKYPKDFSLFRMGTWDNESGAFKNETSPVELVRASNLLIEIEQEREFSVMKNKEDGNA